MVIRNVYRELTVLACALAAAAVSILARPPVALDGTLFDLMIVARAQLFTAPVERSQVAVVALDWRSLKSDRLAGYPQELLRPVWAEIARLVLDSGAQAVGFDMIFQSDLGKMPELKSFDLPLESAIVKYRDRIVLGCSKSINPAPSIADLAAPGSIASLHVARDGDGRQRRLARGYWRGKEFVPAFYAALAGHAKEPPRLPAVMLIAPRRHLETIPTYSLVDVLRCSGDPGALAAAFRGKIVLAGVDNPMEDRQESSGRFLPPPRGGKTIAPCGLKVLGASSAASQSVPGIFVHAAALDEVLHGQVTSTAPPIVVASIGSIAAALIAAVAMYIGPQFGIVLAGCLVPAMFVGATAALNRDYYVPIITPMILVGVVSVFAYVVNYLVVERSRRRVQNAFGHFLSPAIVADLADSPEKLRLGGERREVTIMFADLSGFTALSTQLDPEALTSKVNRYLGLVVERVEDAHGYVDKFIGDAVMAIWGAPAPDAQHAQHAVRAALAAIEKIEQARRDDEAAGQPGLSIKIGINSGNAVVGNVGTERRLNYTAVGETVNLASRLEGVPALYGCQIVLAERTAELVYDDFLLYELDRIMVKGVDVPVAIFEPVCERRASAGAPMRRVNRFSDALQLFRLKRFEEAARIWDELAHEEAATGASNGSRTSARGPAAAMAARARELIAEPPGEHWNGARVVHK